MSRIPFHKSDILEYEYYQWTYNSGKHIGQATSKSGEN